MTFARSALRNSPDRLHVLVTVNVAWNIWNFRRELMRALLNDGHSVTILAPPDGSEALLEELGCKFIALDMDRRGLNPSHEFQLLRRFEAIFAVERPDIVLSFTIKNNIYGAIAARKLAIPFVPNVTGLGTAFLGGGALQMVARSLYRHAFRSVPLVFFQNDDDRKLFIDRRLVRTDQAKLLPGSGIDLEHFKAALYPAPEAPPVFLMIARLLRDKGVHEFVDAARIVRSKHPSARFQLLGPIGSENRTAIDRSTVESWLSEGVIEYLGTLDDVRGAIADAHCVVLPSYREGAPRTLIEAAAMARPIIATNVPGCRAVLDDNVTGYLCGVRDAVSLAEAFERFLELSPREREAMGAAGRAKMEREFDHAIVVKAYRENIRRTVRRSEGAA